ncbi:MAG TPA: ABC transporter ATP-binding protein [Stellaceae bacterium]|jgi:NitT/TauT family transport system ATP-binding protein
MELVVDSVSHDFGDLAVMRDISFRVASGEILALVGPSGCGKSTMLGIVGGLLQPGAGTVATVGAPPRGSLNPLTFVFQDFALLPWRSVAANVAFVLEHAQLAPAERQAIVADTLRRTGLAEFAHSYPKQLSGGMRQRVGIARALAVRPEILLMDEPFSALDAQTRDLLIEDFMRLMAGNRLGAVYVTHNLKEAARLADRIVVLSRRPARIRETIVLDRPRAARDDAYIAAHQRALWSLIRDEAADAEREVANV